MGGAGAGVVNGSVARELIQGIRHLLLDCEAVGGDQTELHKAEAPPVCNTHTLIIKFSFHL